MSLYDDLLDDGVPRAEAIALAFEFADEVRLDVTSFIAGYRGDETLTITHDDAYAGGAFAAHLESEYIDERRARCACEGDYCTDPDCDWPD